MPDAIAATPDTPAAMPADTRRVAPRWLPWATLAGAVALAAVAGFGGIAAIAALLAQPAFALAVAQFRGRRFATPRALLGESGWLALLWGGAFALAVAVVTWPLSALIEGSSLLSALGLSLMAGVLLLGAWRLWPLWHGMETEDRKSVV